MKKTKTIFLTLGVAITASILFNACVKENPDSPGFEYMPDMYRSPSVETNGKNPWNSKNDSMGNMLPPEGTIPVGFTPFPYPNTPQGDTMASMYWKSPIPHSDSIEDKGKFLFTRFCIYCHGAAGDGQGPLVSSGKYGAQPPNYADLYKKGWLTDGHIYWVITYGIRNMGSHAGQVSPEERWQIIQYVQRLGRGGKAWSAWQADLAAMQTATDSTKPKPAAGNNGTK
ncbi:MAG TPA: cytochrome c [Bacteroidia bacterium]|nr:cytochrome c [Bacteroidia bacterium]